MSPTAARRNPPRRPERPARSDSIAAVGAEWGRSYGPVVPEGEARVRVAQLLAPATPTKLEVTT
jgi:hypothetical protein